MRKKSSSTKERIKGVWRRGGLHLEFAAMWKNEGIWERHQESGGLQD